MVTKMRAVGLLNRCRRHCFTYIDFIGACNFLWKMISDLCLHHLTFLVNLNLTHVILCACNFVIACDCMIIQTVFTGAVTVTQLMKALLLIVVDPADTTLQPSLPGTATSH